jgi:hypothetical protein
METRSMLSYLINSEIHNCPYSSISEIPVCLIGKDQESTMSARGVTQWQDTYLSFAKPWV